MGNMARSTWRLLRLHAVPIFTLPDVCDIVVDINTRDSVLVCYVMAVSIAANRIRALPQEAIAIIVARHLRDIRQLIDIRQFETNTFIAYTLGAIVYVARRAFDSM